MKPYDHVMFVGQAANFRDTSPLLDKTGELLADVLGLTLLNFSNFPRFNLNPVRFSSGQFDENVGIAIAKTIQEFPGIDRYVLLGTKVSKCFGLPWENFKVHHVNGKQFLNLQHPDGLHAICHLKKQRYFIGSALDNFIRNK